MIQKCDNHLSEQKNDYDKKTHESIQTSFHKFVITIIWRTQIMPLVIENERTPQKS